MGRKLKTIYEYLNEFKKEDIDKAIANLSDNHKRIIFLRYGEDLENPVTSKLFDDDAKYTFYGFIIPKLKKELKKSMNVMDNKVSTVILNEDPKTDEKPIITKEELKENSKDMVLSKEDYLKALSLLQSPNFTKILSDFSIEEAVIICLKLGYIDGKYFDTKVVSEFLNIDEKRIYEIVHRFLSIYKENVLEFIDKIIEGTNKDNFSLIKK